MKVSEADILILPGYGDTPQDHWQRRWLDKLRTARWVDHQEWLRPQKDDWTKDLVDAVEQAQRPVVLVAHSLGVITAVHAARNLPAGKVKGGFFVAPSNCERVDLRPELAGQGFDPIPREPLPFPSHLTASRNDPYCDYDVAGEFALAWGSKLFDAGESGHINAESGQGPWPEGLIAFAHFMKNL